MEWGRESGEKREAEIDRSHREMWTTPIPNRRAGMHLINKHGDLRFEEDDEVRI